MNDDKDLPTSDLDYIIGFCVGALCGLVGAMVGIVTAFA